MLYFLFRGVTCYAPTRKIPNIQTGSDEIIQNICFAFKSEDSNDGTALNGGKQFTPQPSAAREDGKKAISVERQRVEIRLAASEKSAPMNQEERWQRRVCFRRQVNIKNLPGVSAGDIGDIKVNKGIVCLNRAQRQAQQQNNRQAFERTGKTHAAGHNQPIMACFCASSWRDPARFSSHVCAHGAWYVFPPAARRRVRASSSCVRIVVYPGFP